jgi:HPt (histidine-containing phosphotransfer) domain-containing protein
MKRASERSLMLVNLLLLLLYRELKKRMEPEATPPAYRSYAKTESAFFPAKESYTSHLVRLAELAMTLEKHIAAHGSSENLTESGASLTEADMEVMERFLARRREEQSSPEERSPSQGRVEEESPFFFPSAVAEAPEAEDESAEAAGETVV